MMDKATAENFAKRRYRNSDGSPMSVQQTEEMIFVLLGFKPAIVKYKDWKRQAIYSRGQFLRPGPQR